MLRCPCRSDYHLLLPGRNWQLSQRPVASWENHRADFVCKSDATARWVDLDAYHLDSDGVSLPSSSHRCNLRFESIWPSCRRETSLESLVRLVSIHSIARSYTGQLVIGRRSSDDGSHWSCLWNEKSELRDVSEGKQSDYSRQGIG